MTATPTKQEVKHFLDFPYAQIIFGKPFSMTVTVEFAVVRGSAEEEFIIEGLTGVSETGNLMVMDYLLEEEPYASFVMQCIRANEAYWNERDETPWWEKA